jgi:hypothetical protein
MPSLRWRTWRCGTSATSATRAPNALFCRFMHPAGLHAREIARRRRKIAGLSGSNGGKPRANQRPVFQSINPTRAHARGAERKNAYEAVQRAAMKTWKGEGTSKTQNANPKSSRAFHQKKSIVSAHSTFISNTSMRRSRRSVWNNTDAGRSVGSADPGQYSVRVAVVYS